MIEIKQYVKVNSLDEGYKILIEEKDNAILGGGCFANLLNQKINVGIDLSKLDLNQIYNQSGKLVIGSENTLSQVENHPLVRNLGGGILRRTIHNIAGTQLRNTAKFGASLYGKYGFSDIIPVLLVFNTYLDFYKRGSITLSEYLEMPFFRDILVRVRIDLTEDQVFYASRRKVAIDMPQLNVACSLFENKTVAVGARPASAKRFDILAEVVLGTRTIEDINLSPLGLSSDLRATAHQRKILLIDMLDEIKQKIRGV